MAEERLIDVRKQANLPLARTFDLCVKGISHRLLRSVLTLAVVVLAVAFFMFLLSENALIGATAQGVRRESAEQKLAGRLLGRLFNAPTSVIMSERLSKELRGHEGQLAECARVTGWETPRIHRLAEQCAQEQAYLDFFNSIPVGKRMVLVQKLKDREIFRSLASPDARKLFAENIKPMLDLRVPGGLAAFSSFLDAFPAYEKELTSFTEAWGSAVATFSKASADLTSNAAIENWLCSATPDQVQAWTTLGTQRGFALEPRVIGQVQSQLRTARVSKEIWDKLDAPDKRMEWRNVFPQGQPISTQEKLLRLDDERVVKLLDRAYPRHQLAGVSAHANYLKTLSAYETSLTGRVDANADGHTLNGRQAFLLCISFLVCMVGIANAMLMSITERFREIATMKCLGATDRYILIQFMLEAGLQGVAGGLLGMLIGFVIALTKNSISFGSYVFAYWPMGGILLGAVISVMAGVLLAMLASIYPSWAASRMQPMEAMRIE